MAIFNSKLFVYQGVPHTKIRGISSFPSVAINSRLRVSHREPLEEPLPTVPTVPRVPPSPPGWGADAMERAALARPRGWLERRASAWETRAGSPMEGPRNSRLETSTNAIVFSRDPGKTTCINGQVDTTRIQSIQHWYSLSGQLKMNWIEYKCCVNWW